MEALLTTHKKSVADYLIEDYEFFFTKNYNSLLQRWTSPTF